MMVVMMMMMVGMMMVVVVVDSLGEVGSKENMVPSYCQLCLIIEGGDQLYLIIEGGEQRKKGGV